MTPRQINYRKVGEEFRNTLRKSKPSTLTKTVPGLENGSEYIFQIRARNNIGWSQWSETVKATPVSTKVVLSTSKLTVEEGDTKTCTVKLDTQPRGKVVVIPESIDKSKVSIKTVSSSDILMLTFTTSNWSSGQTVTVTGEPDLDANDEEVTVSHTLTGYGVVTPEECLEVTVIDDDTTGVTLSQNDVTVSKLMINEGSTDTYTVVLDTIPSGDVTVMPSIDESAVDISSAIPLTFTTSNWNQPQTVTITSKDDHIDTDENKTLNLSHE